MDNTDNHWAADIIEAARQSMQTSSIYGENNTLIFTRHKDQVIEIIDLEQYNPAPSRIKKALTVTEVKSFVDYWTEFANPGSVIMADLEHRLFKAVFDYHQPDKPAWGSHTCTLRCIYSTEWKTWHGNDKKQMNQTDFAEFIESNAIDIVEPAAAQMIEVALTLQAKTKVDFASGVRLENGQVQLTYKEEITGTAGVKGEIKIPDKFTLAVRIFQGGEKYKVECHLRYRINSGKLVFFYQIIRPERLIEDAFEQVKKQVETGCTGASIYATD